VSSMTAGRTVAPSLLPPPPPPGNTGTKPARPSLSIRFAAYLAILFGIFGAISGIVAAPTFIPFAHASTFDASLAGALTVIAAIGVVVSIAAVVAGRALLRASSWAWNGVLVAAVASVGLVGVMAGLWPQFLPFTVLVAIAYGLVTLLLLLGHRSYAAARPRGSTG
jgi:asparagine N-glycosylation enzyme membrane subunit Stt3